MGIFDKLKGGKKDKVFEDELMDTQSELIALTLNMVGKAADKIFAYCSIEAKSQMFNVFFELDGKIKTLNEMGIVPSRAMELLRTGTHGLDKIKEVCAKYNYPTPTEIKMKTNYPVTPRQKRSRCRSNRGIIDSPTPLFTPFCRFRYRSRGQTHSHQYPRTSSTNDPFLKWFSYTSRMMRIAMSTSPF